VLARYSGPKLTRWHHDRKELMRTRPEKVDELARSMLATGQAALTMAEIERRRNFSRGG